MQDIEQQGFQHVRRVSPAHEVEGLKTPERQGIVGVIKETMLAIFGPTVQPFLQFTDNVAEAGHGALSRFQRIDPFNSVPELPLFLKVQPIALLVSFDQHAKEAEEKLLVFFAGIEREWIDREVTRVLGDIQVGTAEN